MAAHTKGREGAGGGATTLATAGPRAGRGGAAGRARPTDGQRQAAGPGGGEGAAAAGPPTCHDAPLPSSGASTSWWRWRRPPALQRASAGGRARARGCCTGQCHFRIDRGGWDGGGRVRRGGAQGSRVAPRRGGGGKGGPARGMDRQREGRGRVARRSVRGVWSGGAGCPVRLRVRQGRARAGRRAADGGTRAAPAAPRGASIAPRRGGRGQWGAHLDACGSWLAVRLLPRAGRGQPRRGPPTPKRGGPRPRTRPAVVVGRCEGSLGGPDRLDPGPGLNHSVNAIELNRKYNIVWRAVQLRLTRVDPPHPPSYIGILSRVHPRLKCVP